MKHNVLTGIAVFLTVIILSGCGGNVKKVNVDASKAAVDSVKAGRKDKKTGLLLKGGHVIDSKNNINEIMDVEIRDGKIAQMAKDIAAKPDELVVNAQGMYVTPGLIDMHVHVFHGAGRGDPDPDGFSFRNGVTTMVDAGSSGWKSFPDFKQQTIDRSETRVLAFLNISAEGYRGKNESDTSQMNSKLSADFALKNKEYIVGFKVAHFSGPNLIIPVSRAIEAGRIAGIPFMLDGRLDEQILKLFRPGDIYTHMYGRPLVDLTTGKLKPFVVEARNRGVFFDVGFGGASFGFVQAIPALKSGFYPNTMGTDLNYHSYNGAMKSILNVMSTFLAMGMDLPAVIKASTWMPAQVIKHEELGHLTVGAVADVTILSIRQGKFGYWDMDNYKIPGNQKLECELTVREGKIVYDFNGISISNP